MNFNLVPGNSLDLHIYRNRFLLYMALPAPKATLLGTFDSEDFSWST